jgi:spore coat polysaccharide biosynthesis predicted glycosyltransferase SpsG
MVFEFNPRISGGFVEHILRNPRLANFIKELKEECDFTDKEIHDNFKDIIIAAFSEYKVDINDEINKAKRQAAAEER